MTADDSRIRWWSRSVVLAAGALLGLFIWRTYVDHVPHLYPIEFSQGQWLVASDGRPQGYFRKELYIPTTIKQAWITVAATDSFVLYLNGKAVESKGYASLNVSGIYDIGPYLHAGKNVLGVVARRLSFPGPAMAALEGAYLDETGREHAVASDASWTFSPVEQRQGGGEILWYAEAFDATSWAPATVAGRPKSSEIYPLSVHPLAFALPPQGRWIGYSSSPQDRPTFSHTLRLGSRAEEAWIRIAAAHSYSLVINGVAVQGEPARDLPSVGMDGASMWKNDRQVSTDLYNITSLLHAGLNRIAVSSARSPFLPGLFVDGFVIHQGELLTFGTDATWAISFPAGTADHDVSAQLHTIALANNGPLPAKAAMRLMAPLSYAAKQSARMVSVLGLTMAVLYAFWRGTSRIIAPLRQGGATAAMSLDAFVHLPVVLALCGLFFLTFDVRFSPAFPFQPRVVLLSVAALVALKLVLILEAWYRKRREREVPQGPSPEPPRPARQVYVASLIAVTLVGAFLRLRNLDAQSLYHDEIQMVTYVQGFLEKGYPYKMIGPIERPLATYELVPFPIALAVKLFGLNDFALRLPAALFGIATISLIYVVGTQVFNRPVGLLAATIYTFCPQAIIWAQYLWHPQQTQFFALLTSSLFYRAIRTTPLSPRYLYLAALSFIITYLSWEGAGFFLPALSLGLLAVKGREWTWVRDRHLWLAVALVCVAVMLQLIRRTLLQYPYLVVGQGLSDVSLPTLYFLDPMYDPIFYLKNFLWLENNVVLTLLLLAGMPFIVRQCGFAYFCALMFSVIFMMTNLLSNAATRYVYYLQPFLILSASASSLYILNRTILFVQNTVYHFIYIVKYVVSAVFILIIISSTSMFMKLYALSNFSYQSGIYIRTGIYYIDYKNTSKYVESHYRSGDLVISVMPGSLDFYSRIESNYFIENYTIRQVFYDPTESYLRYLERTVGNPVIRDFDELHDIINNYDRVWVIAVPYSIFLKTLSEEMKQYIQKEGKVVYESYNARVYFLRS
jgi:hypothetical protein